MKKLIITFIFSLILVSCNDNSSQPNIEPTSMDDLVRQAGVLNTSVNEHKTELSSKTFLNQIENGNKWNISETRYSLAKNIGDAILPLNPNAGTLWPGALVQGNEVPNGILNSLGDNILRKPITITVESGTSFIGNRTIENPTKASYAEALNSLLNEKNVKGAAKQQLMFKFAHSKEQAALELGFSAKWLASFNANFETRNNSEEKSVFLLFKQTYFTVSTSEPTRPSDYFSDDFNFQNISHIVKPSNPLCFVSSVDYGRIILVKMSYKGNESFDKVEANVKDDFGAFETGGSYNSSSISQNSTFEGLIIGGSNGAASRAFSSRSLSEIFKLIQEESEFTTNTPAFPISYVVKNMANNSIVKIGESTEYVVKQYTYSDDNDQLFDIYLSHFNIIDDGNFLVDGDFYYTIRLSDKNGSTLRDANGNLAELSINRDMSIKVGSGGRLNIPTSSSQFKGIKLVNNSTEQFTISVDLYDKFSSGNDVLAGSQGRIFKYPWDIPSGFITMPLVCQSNNYDTEFVFRIDKK